MQQKDINPFYDPDNYNPFNVTSKLFSMSVRSLHRNMVSL